MNESYSKSFWEGTEKDTKIPSDLKMVMKLENVSMLQEQWDFVGRYLKKYVDTSIVDIAMGNLMYIGALTVFMTEVEDIIDTNNFMKWLKSNLVPMPKEYEFKRVVGGEK